MTAMAEGKFVNRERLQQILPVAFTEYKNLVPELERMVEYRFETLSQLNLVAEKLKKRHKKVNVAKFVGTAVGVGGTAVTAAGVAVTPFALPVGVSIASGGMAIVGVGTATAVGAYATEKRCEMLDMKKVQQAIDRDRAQCENVSRLWKEFGDYCVDIENTVEKMAAIREESDIATSVMGAVGRIGSPIILLAETFHLKLKELGEKCSPEEIGGTLFLALGEAAQYILENPGKTRCVVSRIQRNIFTGLWTVAFVTIALIGFAHLLGLIMTFMDMKKGSPSKLGNQLSEVYEKLEKEYLEWLDAFGNKDQCKLQT